jgi:predicted metal-dependent hydrolase
MIATRRLERNFADGLIAEAVEDLWEPWMRHADKALEDDALLLIIQQELAKRCKKSKTRGRKATPADVVGNVRNSVESSDSRVTHTLRRLSTLDNLRLRWSLSF